jgi:riboflavin synthase
MSALHAAHLPIAFPSNQIQAPPQQKLKTTIISVETPSEVIKDKLFKWPIRFSTEVSMFTGIIEEKGIVLSLKRDKATKGADPDKVGWILIVQSASGITVEGVTLGDSIAVNGVCLTVTHYDEAKKAFTFGCAPETMRRTNLGKLKTGSEVNLERALHVSIPGRERFGGHFVEGHVDGTGTIESMTPEEETLRIKIKVDPTMMRYIVEKGYICIDGTSLTVCDVGEDFFTIMMISFTQSKVIIAKKKPGDTVNLELDILAKYVEKVALGKVDTEKVVQKVWSHVGDNLAKTKGKSKL